MSKIKNKPCLFVGGPFHYQTQKMDSCLKTHKIRSKDYIGEYKRESIASYHMTWEECTKRWYLIDSTADVSQEKLDKLGCWGIVEIYTRWHTTPEKRTLVRCVGIDENSQFSAFELYYSDYIIHINTKGHKTLFDFKNNT
jgi:hypothetical protein